MPSNNRWRVRETRWCRRGRWERLSARGSNPAALDAPGELRSISVRPDASRGPSTSPLAVTMKPFAQFAVYFTAGLLLTMLLWSTISVYVLDQYERAWGHGGSVQVLWWLSILGAIAALFGAGSGAHLLAPHRTISARVAFISGVTFLPVSAAIVWLLGVTDGRVPGPIVLLWFFLGPAALGGALGRLLGRAAAS